METKDLTGIGVAGCGRMGAGMLRALLAAGFDARGHDIRPVPDLPVTLDAADFARGLRILFTVVRDVEETEALLFGAQNLAQAPDISHLIICSTLSPRYVLGLRDRLPGHLILIDAPMSGAQIAAEEARLSFMLGGTVEDISPVMPLFRAMGKHFHHMGPFGAGMAAKVLNNLMAAASTATTRLALDWADRAGLDERAFLDLVHTSSGQNWLASGFDEIEFSRDGHAPDNTIGILVKDVQSALDAAPEGSDTALPRALIDALGTLKPRP